MLHQHPLDDIGTTFRSKDGLLMQDCRRDQKGWKIYGMHSRNPHPSSLW